MITTTLNELVFELLELRRAQLKKTDPIDRRLVIDWVQSQRAFLLEQKFRKPLRNIDDNLVQDLGADIALEKVAANDIGITDYKYMLRTTNEIPMTIDRPGGIGTFTRIGPPDKTLPGYEIVTYNHAFNKGNGHFDYNSIYAFRLGGYIYLISRSGFHLTQSYVHIRGVFQDAITAARFADATWDYDDNYPINKYIIDQLKKLIVADKFNLTLIQAEDKVDDASDESTANANLQTGQA